MKPTLLIAAGFAWFVSASLPVQAQVSASSADPRQVSVSVRDLDLNSKAGALEVIRRLKKAAAKVCGPAPDIRDLDRLASFKACADRAQADAVGALGNAEVTAAFSRNIKDPESAAAAGDQPSS